MIIFPADPTPGQIFIADNGITYTWDGNKWVGDLVNTSISNGTSNVQIASQNGNVTVAANATTWIFDDTGNLTIPSGGSLYSEGFTPSGAPGNTIILNPHGSGSITNQKFMVYPTAGDGDHIHMTTGNLYQTELFLGNDTFYVKLENTGNVAIRTDDANGHVASWTFGVDSTLTIPGTISSNNSEGTAIESVNGGNTTGLYLNSNKTASGNAFVYATNNVYLRADNNGVNKDWIFDVGGNLAAPGSISATGNINGGNVSTVGNVTANYFIGDGSQLTGLPASYGDSNVASFLSAYGSNTVSTTGNITAGNFIGSGANVDIVAGAYDWTFVNDGNLVLPGNTFAVKYANGVAVSLGGNYSDSNVVTLLGSFGSNSISTTGNVTASYQLGNGSQLTAVNAATVDILDTNGLTTTFYPTFIENRDSAEIVRADVDLTYRTDTNTLGVGNVNVSGTISATGNITGNTAGFTIGYRDIPQVTFSANATAALTDAGKHYYSTTAGNLSLTLPDNSSVAFPTGATLTIVVNASGNVLVNQGSGVSLYQAGASATGNRVVGAYGLASVMKIAANTWVISGTGVY